MNLRKHVRKTHPEALLPPKGTASRAKDLSGDSKKNLAAAVLAAALRIKKGTNNKKKGNTPDKPKPFQCLFCDKSYARQDALEVHSKSHKGIMMTEDLEHETVIDHSQNMTEEIHHQDGGLINVSVIGSEKVTTLTSHDQGPIILQPMPNEISIKPVQILSHNPQQLNPQQFTHSLLHTHNGTQHHTQHFNPQNLMAVPTPAPSGHITLSHMGQHIPTTTHHLMEPAQHQNLPVVQSADGHTHYLIIQPQEHH